MDYSKAFKIGNLYRLVLEHGFRYAILLDENGYIMDRVGNNDVLMALDWTFYVRSMTIKCLYKNKIGFLAIYIEEGYLEPLSKYDDP